MPTSSLRLTAPSSYRLGRLGRLGRLAVLGALTAVALGGCGASTQSGAETTSPSTLTIDTAATAPTTTPTTTTPTTTPTTTATTTPTTGGTVTPTDQTQPGTIPTRPLSANPPPTPARPTGPPTAPSDQITPQVLIGVVSRAPQGCLVLTTDVAAYALVGAAAPDALIHPRVRITGMPHPELPRSCDLIVIEVTSVSATS